MVFEDVVKLILDEVRSVSNVLEIFVDYDIMMCR